MKEATQELADRIRALIGHKPGVTEKKMFGGYGFMLNGNMVVGAMSSGAMLMRVGPENHAAALGKPGAHAMHQGGRQMVGFVEVTDDGIDDEDNFREWIDYSWKIVKAMPPKVEKPKAAKQAAAKAAPKAAAGKASVKTSKATKKAAPAKAARETGRR